MGVGYIEPGHRYELDGHVYKLARELTVDEWQSECVSTGRYVTNTKDELLSLYLKGRLKLITGKNSSSQTSTDQDTDKTLQQQLDLLPPKKRDAAERREKYVKAVIAADLSKFTPYTLTPIINAVHEKLGFAGEKPNWSSVNRWRKRYSEAGKDIRALIGQDNLKGDRTPRYDAKLYELVDQAINDIYMQLERGNVKDTLNHAVALVAKENKYRLAGDQLPLPTYSFVKIRIAKIPAYDLFCARHGKQAAFREFRGVLNSITAEMPLDRAEIDHSLFNILVVDDEHMLPLGRPTLTACIDVASRCFLGIYIGFESASYLTAAQCLRHAFLPKLDLNDKYPSVKGKWDAHGVMRILGVDNAFEFHGNDLEALCKPFGITLLFTPRKTPWYKPYIERAIGTMNRGVTRGIPGTTFEGILEKEDYDAAKNATVTLSTFKQIVHVLIVDHYHNDKHMTLNAKPIDVWRENISKIPIPLPTSIEDFDSLLGSIDKRSLTHKGIEKNLLFYNSNELIELRMRHGSNIEVTIRYNKADLGYIFVINPGTGRPLRVPAINQLYANGLSEWQHKVCKKYARLNLDRVDIEALAEAKETIRDLIAKDLFNKNITTRKRKHRFMANADPDKPSNSVNKSDAANPKRTNDNFVDETVVNDMNPISQTVDTSPATSKQDDFPISVRRKLNVFVE